MKRTLFLLSILSKTLFALLFVMDLLVLVKLSGEFATHGIQGVRGWILHMSSGGRGITAPSGPGVFVVHVPPQGPVFREFLIMCGVLLVLTLLSFWAGRFFGRKARQAG